MLFCHFTHDPVPNYSNELLILPHTGVNTSAKASVVSFICFQPTKIPLEDRNGYTDKLMFSKLHIAATLALNTLTDNDMGISGVMFRYVSIKADRK